MHSSTSDPVYFDVSPRLVSYSKLYALLALLICAGSILTSAIEAKHDSYYYMIIISLIASTFTVLFILYFFKRRILIGSKIWFVFVIISVWIVQSIMYMLFVLLKFHPLPPVSTTTPYPSTSMSTTNVTNITNITTSTTTPHRQQYRSINLTQLY
ncbi:unnamed protein product [Didymodactylos carnosus]|uniref:Uncharacterized protein n=1 Tax=Didymodactylos carnosus TaxID=1234261 RepID=A0A8S2HV76_9BILA|nr:unnamed protein product [Didymodactylos carnosus]CAF3681460.1 unnamed protein product [Didymodactylos carnosus]